MAHLVAFGCIIMFILAFIIWRKDKKEMAIIKKQNQAEYEFEKQNKLKQQIEKQAKLKKEQADTKKLNLAIKQFNEQNKVVSVPFSKLNEFLKYVNNVNPSIKISFEISL